MEGTIIFSGLDTYLIAFGSLEDHFLMRNMTVEKAVNGSTLEDADVYLIGPDVPNPVKAIQEITASDNHLSIILLARPGEIKRIKQSIQFSPFVGKNTIVVALEPEIDLLSICKSATQRTKQKRHFHKLLKKQDDPVINPKRIIPQQLGIFLEYAPIAAILLDDHLTVTSFNVQARKFFPGLGVADTQFSQLFDKDDVEAILKFLDDGHHPELRMEITIHQRVLEITSGEVYNMDGIKHYLLLFNDVTELRQEAERIQDILEGLPLMAWTADAVGNINYFTEGWYNYTGHTHEQKEADVWLDVIAEDDRKKFIEQWQLSLKSGKPLQHAARFRNFNNELRWHMVRASPIRNNSREITLWVGTIADIHDQILVTEELERKVRERTHSLEVSNNELEQFAHVSSHDLQEPLRKIRTFTGLLYEESYDKLDPGSRRYLDKISKTAERMSNSLKALLNFTRLHREDPNQVVDLNEILEQVLVDFELMISQKNAVIEAGELPRIKGVPIQLQQMFYNLVNNALKFSRKEVQPQIDISSRLLPASELEKYPELIRFKTYYEIIIKDNGIGFDQLHADKIFTIFQRLHAVADFEGTGIGLSIVKKVIINHNGTIQVNSTPGEGTSFHIILPVE